MDDHTRLTYLTRHYYKLQGIRGAPVWLSILVTQAMSTLTFPSSKHDGWVDAIALLTIGVMGLWSWLAGQYYERHFGRLEANWIALPKSRLYWGLFVVCVPLSFYCVTFTSFREVLPYVFTLVWISPLFDKENPALRRTYFAMAGAIVVLSALFLQLNHWNNRIILVIQCFIFLALGLADHLLLMSLRIPNQKEANA